MDYYDEDDNMDAFDWDEDALRKPPDEYMEKDTDTTNDIATKSEYKDLERVSRPGEGELIGMFSEENVKTHDPLELFRRKVRAISLQLNSKFPNTLSTSDINNMLLKAENISHIDFKSPSSYVLGFIASNGGVRINERSVENVFKSLLPYINNDSTKEYDFVKEPDVIRYARFWITLK